MIKNAIDYAALVERAKDAARIAPNGAFLRELAAAIERLAQPGGDVEPLNWSINTDGKRFAVYSAATVARLIAERDAAKQKHALLEAEFLRSREAAGQIIVGRDVTIANLRAELDALRSVFHINMLRCFPEKSHEDVAAEIDKALAATEPKDKP